MPSKVPVEEPEIDMDESEFDMDDSAMMGGPPPERKEYLWATNLEGNINLEEYTELKNTFRKRTIQVRGRRQRRRAGHFQIVRSRRRCQRKARHRTFRCRREF